MKEERAVLIGKIITYVSWLAGWIILAIKFDWVTYLGFVFFATGLSGLIIWVLVPGMIELKLKKYNILREKIEKIRELGKEIDGINMGKE